MIPQLAPEEPMPQREIELILTRQLATYLATPIFVVDTRGTLLFYNEPAEAILGCRFDENGEMDAGEWGTIFVPLDEVGVPLASDALPLVIALRENRSVHRTFWIRSLDGVLRFIEVTAFPLIGQAGRKLGAVAIFWEVGDHEGHTVGHSGVAGSSGA